MHEAHACGVLYYNCGHVMIGLTHIPPSMLRLASSAIMKPICSIFNHSIQTSTFPTSWKHAIIPPLHKQGDPSGLPNYQPTPILTACNKVFERYIKHQFCHHLSMYGLIYPLQPSIYPGCTTTISLILCNDHWSKSRKFVDTLFIDVTKAD